MVLGGGDTAMDCVRSAIRQGVASVTVAYRRSREQLRASPKEITAAQEEGVELVLHKQPQAFVGEGVLEGVRFADDDAKSVQPCDIAIIAVGQVAERADWLTKLDIATDERGFISVDENGRTSHPKVFVGGDNSHGPNLVVTAVAAGQRASQGIVASLK